MSDIYGRRKSATGKQPTPEKARHVDPAASSATSDPRMASKTGSEHKPHATSSASGSPSRVFGSFASTKNGSKLRSRSGDRHSASPGRSSSAYARSVSALSSTSRYDAVANRLRMEEDLWSQHVESTSRHREDVRERAHRLEEAAKQRARDTLRQETERSRECMNANIQAFQKHVERSHELQALRQEHVEQQAKARREWELRLAQSNEERTEEAARRHLLDLARRRDATHTAVETRSTAAKDRLSQLERQRKQQQRQKEERDSEAARAAYRAAVQRRQEQLDKAREDNQHLLSVTQRAKQIEQRRIAEQLAKEREAERRSQAAQRAHAEQLARRRERKVQAEEEARRKKEAAEARDAARRAAFEAHFEETLAVGEETSFHNKRVARTATKWF